MIPDETVEQVRDAADIVGVIGEYVTLRRVGADFRGPCPFHQGTHRNFSVSTRKRMYYCFVCHEGGDVFNFLQKRLGVDWPTAVKMVAEKSGIEVREVERKREGPDPRERFWEVNAAAADYFRRVLWEEDAGREARDYVASRRVSREIAERIGLGFAPREAGLLRAYLETLGYDEARLLESGLLVRREDGGEARPRFRGRLMFPILDVGGRHVGFGGRLIGPGEPKYLNSAEGPAFSKGKLLYGLSWARNAIRRDDRVLVVEGYFDVLRLLAAGIETAVAPLGTALTEDQAALVTRYSKNVFLLYDSDRAGLKATFRSGDELLRHGAAVQVVSLPEGEDPDTFVDEHGAQGLEAQLGGAIDVFERKIQLLERAGWFGDLQKKRRAIDRLLPTLRATSDPLTRDIYVTRAAEVAGVSRELLLRELGQRAARTARAGQVDGGESAPPEGPPLDGPPPDESQAAAADARRERRRDDRRLGDRRTARTAGGDLLGREFLRALLLAPHQIERVAEQVGPAAFVDPRYRELYDAMRELGGDAAVDALARRVSPGAVEALQELVVSPEEAAQLRVDKTIEQGVPRLRRREAQGTIRRLERELALSDDPAERAPLERKRAQLQKILRELGGQWKLLDRSTS